MRVSRGKQFSYLERTSRVTAVAPIYVWKQTSLLETTRKWAEGQVRSCLKSVVVFGAHPLGCGMVPSRAMDVRSWMRWRERRGETGPFSLGLVAHVLHLPSTWQVRDGGSNLKTRKAGPQEGPTRTGQKPWALESKILCIP